MASEMTFGGDVRAGKVVFDRPFDWTGAVSRHEGKRVNVTIARQEERRSNQANKRYWTVLVPLAGHLLSQTRDVPLSKKQVHYILASAFGGVEDCPVRGRGFQVPVETHLFTTERYWTFCTEIEVWLSEAGYPIPARGERMEASL